MKLRNKKTGEIGRLHCDMNVSPAKYGVFEDADTIRGHYWEYHSLAELNKDWEDVPEEPKEYWYYDTTKMSREIKLRAWSIKKRKYIDIDTLYCANGKICGIVCNGIVYDVDDVILEQDTGIEDKNGKEIYEGDIIREKWYDNDVNRSRDRIGKIEYFCDRFVCWFGGTFVDLGMFPSENIEVIGNIHENEGVLK